MTPQRNRAAKKPGGANLKPFYIALGLIALLGTGAIVYSVKKGGGTAAQKPIQLSPELLASTQQLVASAKGVKAGPDGAPVKILVFSDFTCPACNKFNTDVEPMLRLEFIQTGKIQLVYYDFPLGGEGQHKYGFLAGRAARCANDQGKFWEYHDRLFSRAQDWSYRTSAPIKDFEEYATELGLDGGTFKKCLESDTHADVVTMNRALGDKLGVGSTPTVFLNGRQVGEWHSFPAIKEMIQQITGA